MKAYVSLHFAEPNSQLDGEISYPGYERIEVEYDDDFIGKHINILFSAIPEGEYGVATHMAIGSAKVGQGEIFARVQILPHLKILDIPERRTQKYWMDMGANEEQANAAIEEHGWNRPRVIINGHEIKLPEQMNPIARTVFRLVYSGLIKTEDLHPKIFEAVNDELSKYRIPILTVTRGASANMKGDIRKLNIHEIG